MFTPLAANNTKLRSSLVPTTRSLKLLNCRSNISLVLLAERSHPSYKPRLKTLASHGTLSSADLVTQRSREHNTGTKTAEIQTPVTGKQTLRKYSIVPNVRTHSMLCKRPLAGGYDIYWNLNSPGECTENTLQISHTFYRAAPHTSSRLANVHHALQMLPDALNSSGNVQIMRWAPPVRRNYLTHLRNCRTAITHDYKRQRRVGDRREENIHKSKVKQGFGNWEEDDCVKTKKKSASRMALRSPDTGLLYGEHGAGEEPEFAICSHLLLKSNG